MEKHLKNGFTLIELMVALAVAAILLGVGIPSFSSAVSNSRISSNYNALAQAMYIARSEAVKSSTPVTICPRAEGAADSCGTDWSKGALVFADLDPVFNNATATLGPEDEVLFSQSEFRKGSSLSAHSTNGPAWFVRYRPEGHTNWTGGGYFAVCDDERGSEYSHALNIVLTGDIRKGRPASATDKTPVNVFGDPLAVCD